MKNITKVYTLFLGIIIIFGLSQLLTQCYAPGNNNPVSSQNGHGIISGKVFDAQSIPLSGVTVSIGSKQAFTGPDGKFNLKDVPSGSRMLVSFQKDGYCSNQRVLAVTDYKNSYTEAAMFPTGTQQKLNTSSAFSINIQGAKVDFQANSLVNSDNSAFSGQATIQITYFDPAAAKFFDAFPGEFAGIDNNGQNVPIESFGFIDVEMLDQQNKNLELASGKPATVTMPIPASLQSKAPATMPLWDYDMQKGQWIQAGTATKTGNVYIGQVSHFSKINLDMKYSELCQITGKVVDQNGNPLGGAWVKLSGVDFDGGGAGYAENGGDSSNAGTFEFVRIKANAQIQLVAYYSGFYSNPVTVSTPANGVALDAGNLVITIDPNLVSGWTQIGNLPSGNVTDMQFINSSTGWYVNNGIYRTDDGGASWVKQLDIGGGGDSSTVRSICMIDQNTGWAAGMNVYYTSDGGNNWTKKDITGGTGSYIYQILFINANYGWAVGSKSYRTTDGGTTWSSIDLSGGPNSTVQKIFFVDENTGYIGGYGSLSKTTDGGLTQQKLTLPGNLTYGTISLFFIDANTGWITYSGYKTDNKIFFTNDGGQTFTDQTPALIAGISDVFFIDSQNGWVCGAAGTIFHTTDGGQNWHNQFNKSNGTLTKIRFVDKMTGWVAGSINYTSPVMLYTTTGGEPQ